MWRRHSGLLVGFVLFLPVFLPLLLPHASAQTRRELHEKRQVPSDLEVGGELAGLPSDSTRYVTRDDLLGMPQVNFTVADDANFSGTVKIRGVRLEELARRFGTPAADMIVAICDDGYRAHYTRAYMTAHHPALVLQVNDEPPSGWPKAAEDHTSGMGPYMISHPKFTLGERILSHVEEAQIPWGVVRIEFQQEKVVFAAIAPRGSRAADPDVQAGFRIAAQNCLRCHNAGENGGVKAGRPWDALGARAAASPESFAAYIRDPRAKNPRAQMPGNPQYNDATLNALAAYFRTLAPAAKP
jgi:mono/diheme cytochrome c family protein